MRGPVRSASRRFDPSKVYALTALNDVNRYWTANDAGEAGSAAGFGVIMLVQAGPTAGERLLSRISGNTGWSLDRHSSTGNFWWYVFNGTTYAAPSVALPPVNMGQIVPVVGRFDGANSALQLLFGTSKGSAGFSGTYAPASGVAQRLGQNPPLSPLELPSGVVSWATFQGTPLDALVTDYLMQARLLGELPDAFTLPVVSDAQLAATSPLHWFRGDTYTPNAGSLSQLANRGSGGGTLNVAGGTIAEPFALAALNGRQVFRLTGSQYLDSSLPAASWDFLSNGSGAYILVALVPGAYVTADYLLATSGNTTQGMDLYRSAQNSFSARVVPGGADAVTIGGVATGVPTIIEYGLKEGDALEMVGASMNYPYATDTLNTATGAQTTLRVGARPGTGTLGINADIADIIIYNRKPSDADLAIARGYLLTRYRLGAGTITHRHSVRAELAELLRGVGRGQRGPASLRDRITNATSDRKTRQGSPRVREIDPARDGTKTYGVMGCSLPSHYRTPTGQGFRGAAGGGWTVRFTFRLAAAGASVNEIVVACEDGAGQGWCFQVNNNRIRPRVHNVPFAYRNYASNEFHTHHVTIVHSGAGAEWWLNGVSQGYLAQTAAYVPALSNVASYIGRSQSDANTEVMATSGVFELAGGNWVATAADVTEDYETWLRTRKIRELSTDSHHYDVTKDVVDNGGADNGAPPSVQNRKAGGTGHFTRYGGMRVDGTGLREFGPDYIVSADNASGLLGAVSGWWMETLIRPRLVTTDQQSFFSNTGASASGLHLWIPSNGLVMRAQFGNGTNSFYADSNVVMTAEALTHVLARYNGTNGELFLNGTLVGTTGALTYVLANQLTKIGTLWNGAITQNNVASTQYGVAGGHAVPTNGEVATAAAAALAAGKVVGIPGMTDRLWSFVDDVAEAGGKVPTLYKNRAASTLSLVKVNAPPQLTTHAQRSHCWEAA